MYIQSTANCIHKKNAFLRSFYTESILKTINQLVCVLAVLGHVVESFKQPIHARYKYPLWLCNAENRNPKTDTLVQSSSNLKFTGIMCAQCQAISKHRRFPVRYTQVRLQDVDTITHSNRNKNALTKMRTSVNTIWSPISHTCTIYCI